MSIESGAPELPSLIRILYDNFQDAPWAHFLHRWENIIFSVIIALFISIVISVGARNRALIPRGFQNGIEFIFERFRHLILGILGPEGEKYVPFLGTLFIYILTMNFFGLVPLMKAPSANLNITIGLAICVFVFVQYLNIKHMGFFGFLYHLAGSPKDTLGWIMAPFMFVLEFITQLSRPVTLSLRLFGNVLGEDILIGAFTLLGISLLVAFESPVGIPLQIPFMFLAILTGFMQALVFTLLSTIYILLSIPTKEAH